jgi:hypothetical protein
MKQWKIATSLAIIGALAAPFAFRTYNAPWPQAETWVPLGELNRYFYAAQHTENCGDNPWPDRLEQCRRYQKALEEGGTYEQQPSLLLYLAKNAAAAFAGFVLIFGLTFLLPALIRRYWKWLNT